MIQRNFHWFSIWLKSPEWEPGPNTKIELVSIDVVWTITNGLIVGKPLGQGVASQLIPCVTMLADIDFYMYCLRLTPAHCGWAHL